MGLFDKFRSTEHGTVPVPGEATMLLPAGPVKVRYEEDRAGRDSRAGHGNPFPGAPDELVVTLTPAGGEPIVLERTSRVQRGMGGGTIHQTLGKIELAAPGECTVSASAPGLSAEREALMHKPRLSLRT
jgi:hypothetical protein